MDPFFQTGNGESFHLITVSDDALLRRAAVRGTAAAAAATTETTTYHGTTAATAFSTATNGPATALLFQRELGRSQFHDFVGRWIHQRGKEKGELELPSCNTNNLGNLRAISYM